MNTMHGTVAHVRVIGRCALTGMLVAMLATQSFGQAGSGDPSAAARPDASSVSQVAGNSNAATLPDAEMLPEAPVALANSSAGPASAAMKADETASSTLSSRPQKKHKVKAGWLALGIAGSAALGMGCLIYSLNTRNTSGKVEAGSIFAVPGAAAAGFGFYYAFK